MTTSSTLKPFLLEIGTEEMPYWAVKDGEAQLVERFTRLLTEHFIEHADIRVLAGPRRLALTGMLAEQQADREIRVKGPAAKVAFGPDGEPSQAAIGFARAQGVPVESLVVGEENGGQYVFAVKSIAGGATADVLRENLPKLILNLSFRKSMRWTEGPLRFVRPIRWLVCLLGDDVIPFEIDGLVAGRRTQGHRILAPGWHEIADAARYETILEEEARVVADEEKRRARIIDEARQVCPAGAYPVIDEAVLEEVAQLVEYPHALLGHFDERFLGVPEQVVITAMEHHQRYFPVREKGTDRLLPHFVVIQNGDPAYADIIREGNERVLRARLADAEFFFNEDMKKPLESLVPQLEGVVFQKKLGTMLAKTARVVELAGRACAMLGFSPETRRHAERAAYLAKADLLTDMVGEFPELQGVMGREYAARQGEPSEVAEAIFEHYLPRFAGDRLPESPAGIATALADKIDTVVGYFRAGLEPTGSEDPYSLRRQAQGCAEIILATGADFDLLSFLSEATALYPDEGLRDREETLASLRVFFSQRFERALLKRGFEPAHIAAVCARFLVTPARAFETLESLKEAASDGTLDDIVVAYQRVRNLSRPEVGTEVDESHFVEDAERAFLLALEEAREKLAAATPAEALAHLAKLRPAVDAFFDAVLVMDPDARIRTNRLALLNRARNLYEEIADFSSLLG